VNSKATFDPYEKDVFLSNIKSSISKINVKNESSVHESAKKISSFQNRFKNSNDSFSDESQKFE